jgi:hypothetical protein
MFPKHLGISMPLAGALLEEYLVFTFSKSSLGIGHHFTTL